MSKQTIGIFIFLGFVLGVVAGASFLSLRGGTAANADQVAQADIQNLVARVGRLMFLPQGEQPTVATVADPTKLQDQAFFTNAKKGDRVLIYSRAQKAILYNPTADRIVEVAPISIGTPPAPTPPAPPATPTTKK